MITPKPKQPQPLPQRNLPTSSKDKGGRRKGNTGNGYSSSSSSSSSNNNGASSCAWTLEGIFRCLVCAVGIFYAGVWAGYHMQLLENENGSGIGIGIGSLQCVCDCDCPGGGSKRGSEWKNDLNLRGRGHNGNSNSNSNSNNPKSNNNNNNNSGKEITATSRSMAGTTTLDSLGAAEAFPTPNPTLTPTNNPTHNPTLTPTLTPTHNPTQNPTLTPTQNPTLTPTQNPTHNPTSKPAKQSKNGKVNWQSPESSSASCPKQKPHYQDIFVPRHTGVFASGMEFVDRDEFGSEFELGAPFDPSFHRNNRVMILYSDGKAFPDKNAQKREYPKGGSVLSVADATKNCNNLHVVMTSESRTQQCIAIVGQYESFHVQKFMRSKESKKQEERATKATEPFRLVNRGMQLNGAYSQEVPKRKHYKAFWKILVSYLSSLNDVLTELKPVAKAVAAHNTHNTIVVVVCNYGHTELLLNFVCHARAGGAETAEALDNILVFATDPETHEVVTSMGLTSFYSEAIFGAVPSKAAEEYGDQRYSRIMLAKVYCVHLVSQLGYDLLFQDVDVLWYRDPLKWFHEENSPSEGFDLVFQDDGARTLFYAPYAANTGFYYVRNNEKTQFLMNTLMVQGDLIISQASHQSVLIALLGEHASLYGLRIKTWNRMTNEFPGGHAYHNRHDFMRELVQHHHRPRLGLEGPIATTKGTAMDKANQTETIDPYIFHMSWTANKDNKLKYFEQMGEWFLQDTCNTNINNATTKGKNAKNATQTADYSRYTPSNCCAAKPLVKCHYRDKASVVPCPDAPPATKEKLESFW